MNPIARALATTALAASLGGCTMSALDLEARGTEPIPAKLAQTMKTKSMRAASPILVRIFKRESELEVWKLAASGRYEKLKTYPMCRWSGKLGPKTREGDRQAPEGFYRVSRGNLNPRSSYYLSFDLGYPNRLERALGRTGSNLMVHGACSSSGCFAMSDASMVEVYALAREAFDGGQGSFQVQSFPFRMTARNMAAHRGDPNMAFWSDLKRGYDAFEARRRPLRVGACEGRYAFGADPATLPDDPLGACPADAGVPDLDPGLVAEGTESGADVAPTTSTFAYADGGMHPKFRELLARHGADRLSKMTSLNKTPVSRPNAALADPYASR